MLKSGFWILKSNAKSRKWISPQRNPSSSWIAIKKTENGFHGLSGEIYSREQSGFLFANYGCACKTAVHLELFFKPFFGFTKKKRKERESKNRYFSVEILFRISRSIANPKYSGSSPNGHFRNRKALLSSTFTKRRSVVSIFP